MPCWPGCSAQAGSSGLPKGNALPHWLQWVTEIAADPNSTVVDLLAELLDLAAELLNGTVELAEHLGVFGARWQR